MKAQHLLFSLILSTVSLVPPRTLSAKPIAPSSPYECRQAYQNYYRLKEKKIQVAKMEYSARHKYLDALILECKGVTEGHEDEVQPNCSIKKFEKRWMKLKNKLAIITRNLKIAEFSYRRMCRKWHRSQASSSSLK